MKEISSKNKVIAIVGPTASGKTSFSIELAKQIGGEIVSADSRLVYKGFDIGTAKPTIAERDGVIHHMIDITEPEFDYSAGLYKQQAEVVIDDIISRGKIPVVVGGTGLYIDILLKNYNLPAIEANYELRNELEKLDFEDLFEILVKLDSNAAKNIDKNDRKKLIRYIEILKTTGKTMNESRGIFDSKYDVEWIGKNYDRQTLYKRIEQRVDLMLEQGLVEETKYLLKKHGRIKNLVETIGYREMLAFIDGRCSLEDAVTKLKQNTRNYAKRQLTWFRRNENIKWDIYPKKLKK